MSHNSLQVELSLMSESNVSIPEYCLDYYVQQLLKLVVTTTSLEGLEDLISNIKKSSEEEKYENHPEISYLCDTIIGSKNSGKLDEVINNSALLSRKVNPFNIPSYLALSSKAMQAKSAVKGKDVVVVLGSTGAGKSTTIQYLTGAEMVQKKVMGIDHIEAKEDNDITRMLKSSPESKSETRYIASVPVNYETGNRFRKNTKEIWICDTPGFEDSSGPEVDAANGRGIVEALKQAKSVRIILLQNYRSLGNRFEGIQKLVQTLAKMVPDCKEQTKAISFWFTRFPTDKTTGQHLEELSSQLESFFKSMKPEEKANEAFESLLFRLGDQLEAPDDSDKARIIDPLNRKELNSLLAMLCKDDPSLRINNPLHSFKYSMVSKTQSVVEATASIYEGLILNYLDSSKFELAVYKYKLLKMLTEDLGLKILKNKLNNLDQKMVKKHALIMKDFASARKEFLTISSQESSHMPDRLKYYFEQINDYCVHVAPLFPDESFIDETVSRGDFSKLLQEQFRESVVTNTQGELLEKLKQLLDSGFFDFLSPIYKMFKEQIDKDMKGIVDSAIRDISDSNFSEFKKYYEKMVLLDSIADSHDIEQKHKTGLDKICNNKISNLAREIKSHLTSKSFNQEQLLEAISALGQITEMTNSYVDSQASIEEIKQDLLYFNTESTNSVKNALEVINCDNIKSNIDGSGAIKKQFLDLHKDIENLEFISRLNFENIDFRTNYMNVLSDFSNKVNQVRLEIENIIANANNLLNFDVKALTKNIEILGSLDWMEKYRKGFSTEAVSKVYSKLEEFIDMKIQDIKHIKFTPEHADKITESAVNINWIDEVISNLKVKDRIIEEWGQHKTKMTNDFKGSIESVKEYVGLIKSDSEITNEFKNSVIISPKASSEKKTMLKKMPQSAMSITIEATDEEVSEQKNTPDKDTDRLSSSSSQIERRPSQGRRSIAPRNSIIVMKSPDIDFTAVASSFSYLEATSKIKCLASEVEAEKKSLRLLLKRSIEELKKNIQICQNNMIAPERVNDEDLAKILNIYVASITKAKEITEDPNFDVVYSDLITKDYYKMSQRWITNYRVQTLPTALMQARNVDDVGEVSALINIAKVLSEFDDVESGKKGFFDVFKESQEQLRENLKGDQESVANYLENHDYEKVLATCSRLVVVNEAQCKHKLKLIKNDVNTHLKLKLITLNTKIGMSSASTRRREGDFRSEFKEIDTLFFNIDFALKVLGSDENRIIEESFAEIYKKQYKEAKESMNIKFKKMLDRACRFIENKNFNNASVNIAFCQDIAEVLGMSLDEENKELTGKLTDMMQEKLKELCLEYDINHFNAEKVKSEPGSDTSYGPNPDAIDYMMENPPAKYLSELKKLSEKEEADPDIVSAYESLNSNIIGWYTRLFQSIFNEGPSADKDPEMVMKSIKFAYEDLPEHLSKRIKLTYDNAVTALRELKKNEDERLRVMIDQDTPTQIRRFHDRSRNAVKDKIMVKVQKKMNEVLADSKDKLIKKQALNVKDIKWYYECDKALKDLFVADYGSELNNLIMDNMSTEYQKHVVDTLNASKFEATRVPMMSSASLYLVKMFKEYKIESFPHREKDITSKIFYGQLTSFYRYTEKYFDTLINDRSSNISELGTIATGMTKLNSYINAELKEIDRELVNASQEVGINAIEEKAKSIAQELIDCDIKLKLASEELRFPEDRKKFFKEFDDKYTIIERISTLDIFDADSMDKILNGGKFFLDSCNEFWKKDSLQVIKQIRDEADYTEGQLKGVKSTFDYINEAKDSLGNSTLKKIVHESEESANTMAQEFFVSQQPNNFDPENLSRFTFQLRKVQTVADRVPKLSGPANSCIEKILNLAKVGDTKAVKSNLKNIGRLLSSSAEGVTIMNNHSKDFQHILREMFQSKTKSQDFNYVSSKLTVEEEKHDPDTLAKFYQEYEETYNDLLNKYKFAKDSCKTIANEAIALISMNFGGGDQVEKITWNMNMKTSLPKVLAHIALLWGLIKKTEDDEIEGLHQPLPAQIVAVFKMLGVAAPDQKSLRNHMLEIGTGEGKSVTLALASCILSLYGFDVYCACYSKYLSERDYNDFEDIFKILKVETHVVYGTFQEISEKIINENGEVRKVVGDLIAGKNISFNVEGSKRLKILLIDEIDVFFNKDFYGNAYNPVARIRHDEFLELANYIWNQNQNQGLDLSVVQGSPEYNKYLTLFHKDWHKLIGEALKDMMSDLQRLPSHQYIVTDNKKIGYTHLDRVLTDIVYGYQTMWAYYKEFNAQNVPERTFHESLGLLISCGNFSFAEMPKKFIKVMGVSGTIRSLSSAEKSAITDSCGEMSFTYVPSVFGDRKLKFLPKEDVKAISSSNYYLTLSKEIRERLVGSNGGERAILVFFEDEKELFDYYNSKEFSEFRDACQYLTERSSDDDKKVFVKKAMTAGQVSLSTKSFGRGTDFFCVDSQLNSNGGIHVLQTFLSANKSEEIQIQGRTSRQANNGSYSMIVKKEALSDYNLSAENIDEFNEDNILYPELDKARVKKFVESFSDFKVAALDAKSAHSAAEDLLQQIAKADKSKFLRRLLKFNKGTEPVKTKRIFIGIDATYSMSALLRKLQQKISSMVGRVDNYLTEKGYPPCELMIGYYRNYNVAVDDLCRTSSWEKKPKELQQFLTSFKTDGGWGAEAVESIFYKLNYEISKGWVDSFMLIGDAPAQTRDEVIQKRSQSGRDWNHLPVSSWKEELARNKPVIAKKVPVHTFYMTDYAKSNFQEIASITGGKSYELDINRKDSSVELEKLVTSTIVEGVAGEDARQDFLRTNFSYS